MTPPCPPQPATQTGDEPSPFITEFFMVQCINFVCMAYRAEDGTWREAFNHLELPGFLRVMDCQPDQRR